FPGEIRFGNNRLSANGANGFEHRSRHLRRAEHRRLTAAKNPRLLAANRVERIAEPVAMIESDRRDDANVGIEKIHGIEPPAEPDFEHRDVDATRGENQQRGQRIEFEVSERRPRARTLDALERIDELLIARLRAIHADAFVVANEMRRSEYAGRETH